MLLLFPICLAFCLSHAFVGWNINLKFQDNVLPNKFAASHMKEQLPWVEQAKMFDYDVELLAALEAAGIKDVVVSVPNVELAGMTVEYARNIVARLAIYALNGMRITVAVGNEPLGPWNNGAFKPHLINALVNMQRAIDARSDFKMKVTIPFYSGVLGTSYPPSRGEFSSEVKDIVIQAARIISSKNSSFFINLYPFFAHQSNPTDVPLEYALLQTKHTVDGVTYSNMLAAQVAAVRAALLREDVNFNEANLPIVVGETGWPTAGHASATAENAQKFANAAVSSGISMYLFEAYDEHKKATGSGSSSGSGEDNAVEGHWGFFTEAGVPKYTITRAQESDLTTCSSKFPPSGEVIMLDCPDRTLQGWLASGACVQDRGCGLNHCPGVPKATVLSLCAR